MSEQNTQEERESTAKVLMDYFRDYLLMKEKKLPWPTPQYQFLMLIRVFNAVTSERQEMRELLVAILRFMPKILHSPWFTEADNNDVHECLGICAQIEAVLVRLEGAQ